MSASEVHVFARIVAQEGKADEVRSVLTELVSMVRKETGVLKYHLHEDTKRAGTFLFSETYEDQEAVDRHMKSAVLGKAFSSIGPMLTGRPDIYVTKAVDV